MFNSLKKSSLLPAVRRWDSMFDSVFGKLDLLPGEELRPELEDYIHPEIEVTDQAVTVKIALPGYCKNDIHVEIEHDLLHVHAEHNGNCSGDCKGKKLLRSERIHSEVSQTVRLPGNITAQHASAVCSDGILTVSIPRENKHCTASRKIEIK